MSPEHEPGDLNSPRNGVGTNFEAFMVLGRGIYLIWKQHRPIYGRHCQRSHWLGAQVPFADLSEKLHTDPSTVRTTGRVGVSSVNSLTQARKRNIK